MKAVIFDLDDTLYQELSFVGAAFHQVACYLNLKYQIPADDVFAYMRKCLARQGRGRIFNSVCEHFTIQEPVSELVSIYRNTKPKLTLYTDADEILSFLRERGCLLGVLTDGASVVQHNKVEALNLYKLVDEIMITDDYGEGYQKPGTKGFEKLLQEFDCRPEEAMYVGDNPKKDFIGARALGMQTVRIIRPIGDNMKLPAEPEYEADVTIQLLTQLKEMWNK